ncbi:MAG: hypothetical protein M1822_005992 [Bathelium mastoideum]|nr:MAG: hypothetical protein M1822_005992 [Bathelium mastoideum]
MDSDRFFTERQKLQFPRPKSGPFEYVRSWDGDYLEVDNTKRCSSDRLMFLLNYTAPPPLLTKKGKPRVRQPSPHKDETGKFYSAQCVHYGMKPKSSKEPAKKALLAYAKANDGKFVVPPEVAKVAAELESEFKVKNAEYDAKMHDIETREKQAKETAQKKRKREEDRLLNTIAKKPKKGVALVIPENLSGAYTVAAPAISEGWDISQSLKLRLCRSRTSSHVWGDFDFGIFNGTFRSERLSQSQNGTIKCHWRGRETGTGESSIGPENVIELQFLDEKKTFRGSMHWDCAGRFDIAGELDWERTRNRVFSMHIRRWKDNYRQLNEANYDAENRGRWGGWTQDAKPDRAAVSDTTDGYLSHSDDASDDGASGHLSDESDDEED